MFLDKNRDTLRPDLVDILNNSSLSVSLPCTEFSCLVNSLTWCSFGTVCFKSAA